MDREIFSYRDGTRQRWADPLVIQRELDKQGGPNWSALSLVVTVPAGEMFSKMPAEAQVQAVKESNEATDELAKLARAVFGCQALSDANGKPEGLTDSECLMLLARFIAFLADLEAAARPLSRSPLPSPAPSKSTDSHTG